MHQLRKGTWSPQLTVGTRPATHCKGDTVCFCCSPAVFLASDCLMLLTWCGEAEQHQSASVTCLKCLSHLILEPSEKCSPGWKDEAIQNGNIYPPSQHSFSSSLSVWVSFGALMINIELFTKTEELLAVFFLLLERNGLQWHDWFCFDLITW